jgi:light-regulated signal transduction histidine kinase (bacteriophytochrome)
VGESSHREHSIYGKAILETKNDHQSWLNAASHDLRALLRSIAGFSQILVEEHAANLDATALNYLERVRVASIGAHYNSAIRHALLP